MYLLNTQNEWDTDFFHTLMSEKRIISSKEAKEIRTKLTQAGAIPHLDNNFDWAMLCIGYCFARDFVDSKHRIIPAPNAQGIEIPSFSTCFQDYSRLWLVMLSDVLFKLNPHKSVSKDDLYSLIQSLWHTGAIELNNFWEGCKRFRPTDELSARKLFLNELSDLAIKNAGISLPTSNEYSENHIPSAESQESRLKSALIRQNINIAELALIQVGVRHDIYRLKLNQYIDLEKKHQGLCSELGMKDNALHITPCYNNESHVYNVKLLRNEQTWQKLDHQQFKKALNSYQHNFILPLCVGVDEYGQAHFQDLTEAPHLLIGGSTGSGKTALLRSLLHSLFALCKGHKQLEVAILDPKKVDYPMFTEEAALYSGKIIDDYEEMFQLLIASVEESEQRYQLMKEHNVQKLSQLPESVRPPYRVIVIDELSNLKKHHAGIENELIKLAEKARASGIHLILSTQRPDAETLAGALRSNLPSRIALSVQKSTESKIILDETGAEKLIGKGDHLIKWANSSSYFLHGFNM